MAGRIVRLTAPQLTRRTISRDHDYRLNRLIMAMNPPAPVTTRIQGIATGIVREDDRLNEPDGLEPSRGHFPAC